MRNALVLVPLCIGLTSRFIVPTSTSKVNKFTQMMLKLNPEVIIFKEGDGVQNKFDNSKKIDSLQLNNEEEEEFKKELYIHGLKEDKNINERSFVLVNTRWRKLPHKERFSGQIESSIPNYSNTIVKISSFPYQKLLENTANNIVDGQISNTKQRLKEYYSYLPLIVQPEARVYLNSDEMTKHRPEGKDVNKINTQNDYAESLKTDLKKIATKHDKKINTKTNRNRLVDIAGNEKVGIYNYPINTNKYFKYFNNDVPSNSEYIKKLSNKATEKYEHIYANDEHILWTNKLLQYKLKGLIPDEKALQNYENKMMLDKLHNKCIQQCSSKGGLQGLTKCKNMDCKCKCGRFIYLKELPEFIEY